MVKHCKYLLMFCMWLSVNSVANCQESSFVFPNDWLGTWHGTINIYKNNTIVQSLPMEVNHQLTDAPNTYIWTLNYGENKIDGLRDYRLKVIDKEKGQYVHDEQNSILLDAYVRGNKLISHFEVGGSVLTSSYERIAEGMIFEILVHDSNNLRITGNTIYNEEEIPEVRSYQLTGYQRAVLTKK